MNSQMHEDHDVSRRARQKDTLSAEDLGILLQWHWKYGKLNFPTERRRVESSLLKLWSGFTGTRPATLVANNTSTLKNSRESSADDLSGGTLPTIVIEIPWSVANLSQKLRQNCRLFVTEISISSFYAILTIQSGIS